MVLETIHYFVDSVFKEVLNVSHVQLLLFLYIKLIIVGPNWRVISGNSEGQTSADSPLYEGPAIWSHPIDVHFSSKGIQGKSFEHVKFLNIE